MEIEEVVDFNPSELPVCTFCEGKPSTESHEQENIPEMLSCSEQATLSHLQKNTTDQRCNGTAADIAPTSNTMPDLPVLEGDGLFCNIQPGFVFIGE